MPSLYVIVFLFFPCRRCLLLRHFAIAFYSSSIEKPFSRTHTDMTTWYVFENARARARVHAAHPRGVHCR